MKLDFMNGDCPSQIQLILDNYIILNMCQTALKNLTPI